jgi:hypothetical protein
MIPYSERRRSPNSYNEPELFRSSAIETPLEIYENSRDGCLKKLPKTLPSWLQKRMLFIYNSLQLDEGLVLFC